MSKRSSMPISNTGIEWGGGGGGIGRSKVALVKRECLYFYK